VEFALSAEDRDFVRALRAWLDEAKPEGLGNWTHWHPPGEYELSDSPAAQEFVSRLAADGWLGGSLPREYGGQGWSAVQSFLYLVEMAHRDLPSGGMGAWSVGPALARYGTSYQKSEYLEPLVRGECTFALGLTEPSGGTDLARLTTRAVRDGSEYVINGQKLFTSAAHRSSHIWLAARTAVTDPPHRGVSIFVIPTDAPGVTYTALLTQAGERTNALYLDNVRVHERELVGEEGRGFSVLLEAVDLERLTLCAPEVDIILEELLAQWIDAGAEADDAVGDAIAELMMWSEVALVVGVDAAWHSDQGDRISVEAASCKLISSLLREKATDLALTIVGEGGTPADNAHDQLRPSPLNWHYLGQAYKAAPKYRFAAGGFDVQLDLIAERALGVPRSRTFRSES
jgi:alkylation response protein AidB-like acyl-CoA dehydrogenase